ncbi:MAG: 1,2-phenylacetyl-CoA epoxidase subunit PaaD [Sphingomicrobium sp.]
MGAEAAIRIILAGVEDPEIPAVSVLDLGIVRAISAGKVTITPTYSGCPATHAIEVAIRAALDAAGFRDVLVDTVLSPPWTTDMISEEGKAKLAAYGIAPPTTDKTATCPQCGSADTQEVSRFGSTPCKAQWRCLSCLEPFDRFKCH